MSESSLPPDQCGLHQGTWFSRWGWCLTSVYRWTSHLCTTFPTLRHIPAEGPALSPWKQREGVLVSLSCVWPCRSLWQDLSWDGMLFALQVSTSVWPGTCSPIMWPVLQKPLDASDLSQFLLMLFESLPHNVQPLSWKVRPECQLRRYPNFYHSPLC